MVPARLSAANRSAQRAAVSRVKSTTGKRATSDRLAVALHDEDLAPIADLPQDIAQVARQLGRADGALHGRIIQDSVLYTTAGDPRRRPAPAGWRDFRSGRVELLRGVDEIARVDDVVAVEHLTGLPADQLHRDPFGDARADEVADGGPAEIVEDAAGHPSSATRRRPGLVETSDRRAVRAREDVRDDASELPFALPRDRASPSEQ